MAKKEAQPPKLSTVLTLGVLTLIFGKTLAFVSLATQPVIEVGTDPDSDDRKPGAVYYVRGSEMPAAGWEAKRDAFLGGRQMGLIAFGENELNQWSRRAFADTSPVNGGEEQKTFFEAGIPNFRLKGDRLQIGSRIDSSIIDLKNPLVLVIHGYFQNNGQRPEFVMESATLGRAPIGKIPVLGSLITRFLASNLFNSESGQAIQVAYEDLNEIVVENGRLGFIRS